MKLSRGRVLVEPILPFSPVGLYLPGRPRLPTSGEVVAVGELVEDIQVGDIVCFPAHVFQAFDSGYETFSEQRFFLHEQAILATIREW